MLCHALICKPLAAQPITLCVANYSHLAQLELADSSDGKGAMDINMLIGADYYWELTTGRISRGESGPVAIHTKLGWVLSGPVPSSGQDEPSVNLITSHTLHVSSPEHTMETLDDTLLSFGDLESLVKDPD